MTQSKLIARILFFACAIFLFSCDTILPSSSKADSWYQTFTGKAGNHEIVLHLTKAGNYNGYLWFKDTQHPVMVFSDPTITPQRDSIYLNGGNPNLFITIKGIIKERITGEITIETNGMQDPAERITLSPDDSFTSFFYTATKSSAKLPEKLKNESSYEYFMGTVVPGNTDVLGEKLREHIKKLLGMPASKTDITQWMDSLQNSSLKKWKTEGDTLTIEDAAMMGMSFSEQVHNQLSVQYENEKTMTLANYVYSYEGGAHGNYSTTLLNVDKATGRKLSLEDILSPEGIKALPDLLDKAARRQYRITNTKSLEDNGFFVNSLQPGKNFYITSTGVGFYYSPYEIRPFSDGEINLFVPKDSLELYWLK